MKRMQRTKRPALLRAGALGLALPVLLGVVSCVYQPVPVTSDTTRGGFFTRHTMRGKQDGLHKTIYRSSYLVHPDVLPAGSPAEILMYSSRWIDLEIDGISCRMHFQDTPFAVSDSGIRRFIDKHFVRDRAAIRLEEVSDANRKLVDRGQAAIGMTKKEVLLAIGYPSHIDITTPTADLPREKILESNRWTYRYQRIAFVPIFWKYQFGTDGKLLVRDPP